MIISIDAISQDINKICEEIKKEKHSDVKYQQEESIDKQIANEMKIPHFFHQKEDTKFVVRSYKLLKKLGHVANQYDFSEQFLGKNKFYYGLIICEKRHPSVDAVHNLINSISKINDGMSKKIYLENLYNEGREIIMKRLLKYI